MSDVDEDDDGDYTTDSYDEDDGQTPLGAKKKEVTTPWKYVPVEHANWAFPGGALRQEDPDYVKSRADALVTLYYRLYYLTAVTKAAIVFKIKSPPAHTMHLIDDEFKVVPWTEDQRNLWTGDVDGFLRALEHAAGLQSSLTKVELEARVAKMYPTGSAFIDVPVSGMGKITESPWPKKAALVKDAEAIKARVTALVSTRQEAYFIEMDAFINASSAFEGKVLRISRKFRTIFERFEDEETGDAPKKEKEEEENKPEPPKDSDSEEEDTPDPSKEPKPKSKKTKSAAAQVDTGLVQWEYPRELTGVKDGPEQFVKDRVDALATLYYRMYYLSAATNAVMENALPDTPAVVLKLEGSSFVVKKWDYDTEGVWDGDKSSFLAAVYAGTEKGVKAADRLHNLLASAEEAAVEAKLYSPSSYATTETGQALGKINDVLTMPWSAKTAGAMEEDVSTAFAVAVDPDADSRGAAYFAAMNEIARGAPAFQGLSLRISPDSTVFDVVESDNTLEESDDDDETVGGDSGGGADAKDDNPNPSVDLDAALKDMETKREKAKEDAEAMDKALAELNRQQEENERADKRRQQREEDQLEEARKQRLADLEEERKRQQRADFEHEQLKVLEAAEAAKREREREAAAADQRLKDAKASDNPADIAKAQAEKNEADKASAAAKKSEKTALSFWQKTQRFLRGGVNEEEEEEEGGGGDPAIADSLVDDYLAAIDVASNTAGIPPDAKMGSAVVLTMDADGNTLASKFAVVPESQLGSEYLTRAAQNMVALRNQQGLWTGRSKDYLASQELRSEILDNIELTMYVAALGARLDAERDAMFDKLSKLRLD